MSGNVSLAGVGTGIVTVVVLVIAVLRHATPGDQVAGRPVRTLRVALGCAAVLAAAGWVLDLDWGHPSPSTYEGIVGVITAMLAIALALRLRTPAEGGALLVGWSLLTAAAFLSWPGGFTPAGHFVAEMFLVPTVILAAVYMRSPSPEPAGRQQNVTQGALP
jgi:hypothetical protein